MSESDEGKPRPRRSAAADAPASAVSRELNEDEIDAPSKQTLVMLAVISASTLIMWAAGRAACNYQVEGENLTPRPVSLEQRTRSSKDVGLEFSQSVASAEFSIALQLSTGEAADWAKKEQSACGTCEQQRKAAKGRVFTSAAVLQANSTEALVRTRTIGTPGGEVIRYLGIEREGREWRVSRISSEASAIELKQPSDAAQVPEGSAPEAPEETEKGPEGSSVPAPQADSLAPGAPAPKTKSTSVTTPLTAPPPKTPAPAPSKAQP